MINIARMLFTYIYLILFSIILVEAQEPSSKVIDKQHSPQKIGRPNQKRIFQVDSEEITSKNYPEIIKSFVFPNADIKDVIKTISTDLNVNIIMDPAIASKKISIISYSPITVAEAYQAFLSALAIHGLTVVRSGSFLKILKKEQALKTNTPIRTDNTPLKTDQFITQIIKLKHIDALSLQRKVKPFIDSKSVQSMIFYEPSNMVIVSDHGLNVEKFRKIIKTLDVPTTENIFKVIPIKHAESSKLSQIINKLMGRVSTRYSNYKRRAIQGKDSRGNISITSLSYDDRTNSIIMRGNKAGIKKVMDLVKQLDYYKDPELAGGIFVYKVKHGTAEELADTLNSVIGNTSGSKTNYSKGGGGKKSPLKLQKARANITKGTVQQANTARSFQDVRIIAEKNTNSLLIVSNKYNYQTILGILNKVDISRNQVFIKTIIMELSTDKSNEWKIANYFFPPEGKGLTRVGYGLKDITTDFTSIAGGTLMFPLSILLKKFIPSISSGTTSINPAYYGLSGKADKEGAKAVSGVNGIMIPSLTSLIQFLQNNIGANILSTPQVIALDHQEAIVTIKEKIPIVGSALSSTTNTKSDNLLRTTDYQDVETALKITPHINPDVSSVRLQIEQKIDSIIESARVPEALRDIAVGIKKRTIKTNITLKDKETAVLGGLVKESNITDITKIPILGDLPFIGSLFRNSKTTKTKTNLIVFITPNIIRSSEGHRSVLSRKLQERMKFIRRFLGDRDPYQEVVQSMEPADGLQTSPDVLLKDRSMREADEILLVDEEDLPIKQSMDHKSDLVLPSTTVEPPTMMMDQAPISSDEGASELVLPHYTKEEPPIMMMDQAPVFAEDSPELVLPSSTIQDELSSPLGKDSDILHSEPMMELISPPE